MQQIVRVFILSCSGAADALDRLVSVPLASEDAS